MNLILECDTAKALNHVLVEPVSSNQFYVRAKKGAYFMGLHAMIAKYFSEPVTESDLEEASAVMAQRGMLEEFNLLRWDVIVRECGGLLPMSMRCVPEGSYVGEGEVMMIIETHSPAFSWVPYAIDSLVLRAIWYPSTLATKLMEIKQTLGFEPRIIYDIANRASDSGEGACIAAAMAKFVFPEYDSIQADHYLSQYYAYTPSVAPRRYLSEHNLIVGWENESIFLNKLIGLPDDSYFICLVDTYDVSRCVASLSTEKITRLALAKNVTIYILPDSSEEISELAAIDLLSPYRLAISGLTQSKAIELKQSGLALDRCAFMLEDSVFQDGVSRHTYGFEYKQCAIKRNVLGSWVATGKNNASKPEHSSLRGFQSSKNFQTVFISGKTFVLEPYKVIYQRLNAVC